MRNRFLISGLFVALSATTFAQTHQAHWSYNGKESPEHWGDLLTDYQTCKLGKIQSPVDLESDNGMKVVSKPLNMNYFPTAFQAENNGHTLQVNVAQENAPFITLNDKPFYLKQFHFHTPSEHTFKRKHYPLEVHFVHQSEDKALAVMAVMVQEGQANPALAQVVEKKLAVGQKEKLAQQLDAKALLPKEMIRFRLNGSLTTPPCSENVSWMIFQSPIQASAEQIAAIEAIEGKNNRPTQPLNERVVEIEQ